MLPGTSMQPARAATFSIADGDVAALKTAINTANGNGEDDVIDLALGGTYSLTTVDNTTDGKTALPIIVGDGGHSLSVNGRGSTLSYDGVSGQAVSRILLVNAGAEVLLDSLTLTGGGESGGAAANNGILTLTNCSAHDNNVYSQAGAFFNGAGNSDATLTLINCTVTNNSTSFGGGAIANWAWGGTALLKLINCTFSGNRSVFDPGNAIDNFAGGGAAVVQVGNTIIASPGANVYNYYGQMQTLGNNVATDNCGIWTPGPGDKLGVEPQLDPAGLQDNGGPIKTILIRPGSPAVDNGNNSLAPVLDQRGVSRPQPVGGKSDTGAVELRFNVGLNVTLHTSNGTPIPNAAVQLATTNGTTVAAALSNPNGVAGFTGLTEGNYVVTPGHTNFIFAPAGRTVVLRAATSSADFTGTVAYQVTGQVADAQGKPIGGVTIGAAGTATSDYDTTATTGSNGNYLLKLPAGGYILTPTRANYTFAPASRNINVTTSAANQNFTGTTGYSISGRVTNSLSQGVFNVAITGDNNLGTRVTNTAGYYSIIGLQPGTYTITPIRTGYRFVPVSRTVTVTNANIALQDFRGFAGYSISGRIATNGIGLTGATVKRSGTNVAVQTNSAGYYTFTDVPDGTITITPSMSGKAFLPETRTVTMSGADIGGQNFTAADGYLIHGRIVTSNGIGISGVVVTRDGGPAGLTAATATTNSAGYYSFNNMPNGTYSLTPSLNGNSFTPASRTATVNGANVTGQNFVGTTP